MSGRWKRRFFFPSAGNKLAKPEGVAVDVKAMSRDGGWRIAATATVLGVIGYFVTDWANIFVWVAGIGVLMIGATVLVRWRRRPAS